MNAAILNIVDLSDNFRINKFDGFAKSLQARHSRVGGSPELIDFPGFPLSRE